LCCSRRFRSHATEALREQQTPLAYLAALLEAERYLLDLPTSRRGYATDFAAGARR